MVALIITRSLHNMLCNTGCVDREHVDAKQRDMGRCDIRDDVIPALVIRDVVAIVIRDVIRHVMIQDVVKWGTCVVLNEML